jgi:putative N6-adenine-specific DNA methylase
MCGSGTLAIEAAWMSMRRAPGLHRESYAFKHLRDWPERDWTGLLEAARRLCRPFPPVPLYASDLDPRAVEIARDNAVRAGVDRWIRFAAADFRRAPLPAAPALVAMNPEYGERMGLEEKLAPLYAAIGDDLKTRCTGMHAAIFTGNPELAKRIALRPSRRIPMWNGPIECRLLLYDLYPGTRDPRLLRKHAPA